METSNALSALSALSHESRLAAYRQLVQAGPDGLSVGELRERLELPPATLTAHLNMLRFAGLVRDQRVLVAVEAIEPLAADVDRVAEGIGRLSGRQALHDHARAQREHREERCAARESSGRSLRLQKRHVNPTRRLW